MNFYNKNTSMSPPPRSRFRSFQQLSSVNFYLFPKISPIVSSITVEWFPVLEHYRNETILYMILCLAFFFF